MKIRMLENELLKTVTSGAGHFAEVCARANWAERCEGVNIETMAEFLKYVAI